MAAGNGPELSTCLGSSVSERKCQGAASAKDVLVFDESAKYIKAKRKFQPNTRTHVLQNVLFVLPPADNETAWNQHYCLLGRRLVFAVTLDAFFKSNKRFEREFCVLAGTFLRLWMTNKLLIAIPGKIQLSTRKTLEAFCWQGFTCIKAIL